MVRLLRGALVPRALAWLGIVPSAILVAFLPLRLGGLFPRPLAQAVWLPLLIVEV